MKARARGGGAGEGRPPPLAIAVGLHDRAWSRAVPDVRRRVLRAARAAARAAVAAAPAAAALVPPAGAAFAIALGDDDEVRTLNATWRGRDQPTNVLAFAAADGPPVPLPEGEARPLGDVVVAFETTAREAAAAGRPLADHLVHLVVHGTLHLFGFDHARDDEARMMEALEIRVLAGLGVADPYAEAA